MTKLNQIIAIEKGTKQRVFRFLSEAYKTFQKPALFNGLSRTYSKKDDDGEDYPDESKRVQFQTDSLMEEISDQLTELFDVTATKDWANCQAVADITVDGVTLLESVPATYLLFLEKQLGNLKDEVSKLPELDPSYDWVLDGATYVWKSNPVLTSKTKKVHKPIVKYDATEHHPAQTELITVDEVVGTWTTVQHSGAVEAPRKKELQRRLQKLIDAIKFARESANGSKAEKMKVASPLLNYVFNK